MMYHVVKCDDCGFTMTVPWNVAADQHAKAHGWFIYPPQARCPKCGMPKHDEAAHDAVLDFDRARGRAAGRPRGVPAPDEEQREMVLWPGALLHGRQGRAGHRAYHRLDTRVRGL